MQTIPLNSGTVCTTTATRAPAGASDWIELPTVPIAPEATGTPFTANIAIAPVFGHKLDPTVRTTMILEVGPLTVWVTNDEAPDSPTPPLATVVHAVLPFDM